MKKSLLLSSLLVLTLAACASKGDTIKIGYVGPLTGDAISYGVDALNGLKIAVDETNAAGGINGKKIEIIAEDGRCNAADATSAAQKLVNVDKVFAIIGGQCSSETLAMAPITEAQKVIVVSPLSSNADISKAGDYVFRVTPSDALKGAPIAAYLKKQGSKKVAMISENTPFAQGLRTSVADGLKAAGIDVVFDESVDQGTKDYRTLMTRLKGLEFDAFFPNGQGDATIIEMVKQFRSLGMKQQMVGSEVADSATLGKETKEASDGMKALSSPTLDESTSAGAVFAKTVRDRFGEPKQSMFFTALGHDAGAVLFKAIADVGMDSDKVRDALYAMKGFKGVSATFSFDKNGDVVGMPFGLKEFKDGVAKQIELIEIPAQ